MKSLRVIVPIIVTALVTMLGILSAILLSALVPDGEWAALIKAGIVIFIIGSLLLVIAWPAYFTYIIRQSLKIGQREPDILPEPIKYELCAIPADLTRSRIIMDLASLPRQC